MKVKLRENEPFDKLLRRFKRGVEESDIIREVKEREHYVKPTTERKMKKLAAVKRQARRLKAQQLPAKLH